MKTTVLVIISMALFVGASVSLRLSAPDVDYWHRVLMLTAAYLSGAAAWSIRP